MTTSTLPANYADIFDERALAELIEAEPIEWAQDEDRGVELIVRDIEQMDEGEAQ